MSEHRYILEPYKGINTRYTCPACDKRKEFTLYIDTETNEHIAPEVGKCNREINCGYHYTPKQYFEDNGLSVKIMPVVRQGHQNKRISHVAIPVSYIDTGIFKQSLQGYDSNHFVKYLSYLFGPDEAGKLVSRYFIGTSKHWDGATVFWQIDMAGNIRTGKIMLYNPVTGKRVKEPYKHITWAHCALKLPDYNSQQCFFGEHLLQNNSKPAAIVESEKTAIIASGYLPEYIWLAAGSLTNLNAEKCKILKGRNVILYPDLNGFEKWSIKANELSYITRFAVSELLEQRANETEREQGFDLADYLIKFPLPATTACLNDFANEMLLQSESFISGNLSSESYQKFSLDIEVRLKAANIPLIDFVKIIS